MIEIAQTIIKYEKQFKKLDVNLPKNLKEIDHWLNLPYKSSYQGSIGMPVASVGYGKTDETNTALGFEKSGFHGVVTNWLKTMFPDNGGIVCVIDNLELLEKSSTAKKIVENMRDTLLTIHGIRWVFCGSLGIVTSILSSPRLEGILHEPIEVKGIHINCLKEVIQKRIEKYKNADEYYLPITTDSFTILYEILKNNLRNTLKYANDYCIWIADLEAQPTKNEEKENLFLDWLSEKSTKYKVDIEKHVKVKSFKLFEDAVKLGGSFAFCDFELLGFDNQQMFKLSIKELEIVGLAVCVIDENDNRRKSIQITAKGWFVSQAPAYFTYIERTKK